jgi:hypothetical protein
LSGAVLHDRIADAGIDARFIAARVSEIRGTDAQGRKMAKACDLSTDSVTATSARMPVSLGRIFD